MLYDQITRWGCVKLLYRSSGPVVAQLRQQHEVVQATPMDRPKAVTLANIS